MKTILRTLMTSLLIAATAETVETPSRLLQWSPEEMMKTKIISDVQLSPDNESVLFVVREAKIEEDLSVNLSQIYQAKSNHNDNAILFSHFEMASQPRWSPNGKGIAFLAKQNGIIHLYLTSLSGNETIALTNEKRDIQTFSWSRDGKKIAFVMADETAEEKASTKTSAAYQYKKVREVNRLWMIDVSQPLVQPEALTDDNFCVRGSGDFGTSNCEYDWSPDSSHLTFAYSPTQSLDDYHLDSSLATVNIETGSITLLEKKARFEAIPRYSADGKWIAHLSDDSLEKYAINRRLTVRSSDDTVIRTLAPTFDEGAFLFGQNFLGWTFDDKSLLYFEPKGTQFHLMTVPIDGSPAQEVDTKGIFFKEPALSFDKTKLAFIVQSPSQPPEAFISDWAHFQPMKISSLNDSLKQLPEIKTEITTWNSNDGLEIEGLLTYPLNYEEGKHYPLLVVIHGGPMGFFDETFLGTPSIYPVASFAESGFFILRPNPRGSCGYGKDFRCANYGDWGAQDYFDVMTGVDALIAKGWIDPEHMGVMGWSYGGYLTSWTISQTTRFKAASIGAALSNLVSMAGTTDLHRIITDYLGDFTLKSDLYRERSPIHHVDAMTTPCLIQHGIEDKRVPVSQAYELYHALDRCGKTPLFILYPASGHRITDPKMHLDAINSNLNWFEQHLKP